MWCVKHERPSGAGPSSASAPLRAQRAHPPSRRPCDPSRPEGGRLHPRDRALRTASSTWFSIGDNPPRRAATSSSTAPSNLSGSELRACCACNDERAVDPSLSRMHPFGLLTTDECLNRGAVEPAELDRVGPALEAAAGQQHASGSDLMIAVPAPTWRRRATVIFSRYARHSRGTASVESSARCASSRMRTPPSV